MYSVYQHWDPLEVCIVGRSYPPEFYSWITKSHVRNLFEKIATETEEDFQKIIAKLQEFGVKILRPDITQANLVDGKYLPPPMTPRDYTVMIGTTLYERIPNKFNFELFYNNIKDPSWPDCPSLDHLPNLPQHIQDEIVNVHKINYHIESGRRFEKILDHVRQQGNVIKSDVDRYINGAMITRVGKDLYFGTEFAGQCNDDYNEKNINSINKEFSATRNHIVNTGGHSDGTFCPVAPGLIISLRDVPTYADTFPGWEVVYLPNQSWSAIKPFLDLKKQNRGKWWIPGFEYDQDVINTVEQWLDHWTGYVEETVFDVNMLIIDPKNVIVFNHNDQVFAALQRYGITPHVVTFRHRYFWDGGIHCLTSDLNRRGPMQDFFPQRQ